MALRFRFTTALLLLAGFFLLSTPAAPVSSAPQVPAPKLISPVNGMFMDNGCSPKANGIVWDFDWSDVIGASAYHIKVWKNPALPLINNMNVPASSFHYVSPLSDYIANTNLTGWRWSVRAKVGNVWGPWSVVRNFRVEKLNTDCQ